MLVRSSWWQRLLWPTVIVTAAGTLGAILAANSGESLEGAVRNEISKEATKVEGLKLLYDHTEAGDIARTGAIIFFVALLVAVFAPRFVKVLREKKWWKPVAAVLIVASGAYASWSMYDAGHSGAKSVWHDVKVVGEGD